MSTPLERDDNRENLFWIINRFSIVFYFLKEKEITKIKKTGCQFVTTLVDNIKDSVLISIIRIQRDEYVQHKNVKI